MKLKASNGWPVTKGELSVTGAFERLKCIDPLKRSKTLSEVRSPSAARIAELKPMLVEASAVCVQSMAAVAEPENWLTLTSSPLTVAVTPGMFRLPARLVPWRPNQLAPAPSVSAAIAIEPKVMFRPKPALPICRDWPLPESMVKLPVRSGAPVKDGSVGLTSVRLTSKLAPPETSPKTSRLLTSPATRAMVPLRLSPAADQPGALQSSGVPPAPDAWLT